MSLLLVFVSALGAVIALAVQKRRAQDPGKKQLTTAQTVALGIAIAVGAVGLFVVGLGIFFVIAMSSYGNNK